MLGQEVFGLYATQTQELPNLKLIKRAESIPLSGQCFRAIRESSRPPAVSWAAFSSGISIKTLTQLGGGRNNRKVYIARVSSMPNGTNFVDQHSAADAKIKLFRSLFRGRDDEIGRAHV